MSSLPDNLRPEDYEFAKLLEVKEWRKIAPKRRGHWQANASSPRPKDWKWDESQTEYNARLLAGFIHFCENYVYIRHPERGRIKFELREAQLETVESWINDRYSLILKARQVGFSTLLAIFCLWLAFFFPDRPVLMLSRTEREAIKLLQKAKYALQFLPEWMKAKGPPINQTQTKIEMANGSFIESLPSASDPARGEAAYLIVVDELAFLPNSEQAWSAIEPVADVGGRVIMLSTANGEGNLFHQLWTQARAGNNRFKPLFFPWSAGGRDQDWYELKRNDLPEWQLAQEYPDNEEDAFLKSGRPVFDLRMLRALETRDPEKMGYIDKAGAKFVEDGGALSVWEWPVEGAVYAIGADPSQGLEHSDFASAHVINARNGHLVATWHGHIDPDLFGTDVLAPLGKYYNQALIGVESNNHGLTTLKFLHTVSKYYPIYYERSPRYKKSVPTDILGYRTTQVTKPLMIDEMQEGLRTGRITCPDDKTLSELRTFTREDKGKMSGSPFDDRTISFAIAIQMLKFVFMVEFQPAERVEPGSWADWERRTFGQTFQELLGEGKKRGPKRDRIGKFAVRTPIKK